MYLHLFTNKNPIFMSSIKITKAKLNTTKKGVGLVISFEETDDKGNKVTGPAETHSQVIQPEIQEQFNRMALHFAIMSGYVKAGDVEDIAAPDEKLAESFTVKQFSIGGKEEEGTDGVTLTGSKILPNGKSHNFNTPFYRFNEGEASRYSFMDDLVACLTTLEAEIIAYKKGEKFGESKTPELPFNDKGDGKVTEEGNMAPESAKHKYADKDAMARVAEMGKETKKKSGNKKKVPQTADAPSGEVDA